MIAMRPMGGTTNTPLWEEAALLDSYTQTAKDIDKHILTKEGKRIHLNLREWCIVLIAVIQCSLRHVQVSSIRL